MLAVALAFVLGCGVLGCGATRAVGERSADESRDPGSPSDVIAESDEIALGWHELGPRRVPIVRARVDDHLVRLLVDTGANAHFLERGAARRLGLVARAGASERVGGAEGAASADRVVAPAIELGLRGARASGDWLVVDAPTLAEARLAGVLSPQLAAPDGGALELDLARGRVRVLDASAAAPRLERAAGWAALASLGTSASGAPLFAVDAEVDDVAVRMLVDTGADVQDAAAESPLAARLAPRAIRSARALGFRGAHALSRLDGVSIAVAGWRGTGTVRLADGSADPLPGVDGALGMEVLAHCTLVLSRDAGAIRCAP